MKREFTLGRIVGNDIVIEKSMIGRHHLLITYVSDDQLIIEDQDSKNGTFVNGIRVKKKIISTNDKISLGSFEIDTHTVFSYIKNEITRTKSNFYIEFSEMENIYLDYERKIDRIRKNSQLQPLLIKGGFIVAVMLFAYFAFGNNPNLRYLLMMGAGLVGGLFALLTNSSTKIKDQIDLLDAELYEKYKCPKCGKSLVGKRWKHWAARKRCDHCNAIWTK